MAARNPEVSRNSVVGICDPAGNLRGHGLLIGFTGFTAVLTCHHVIATLKPENLRVLVRGQRGEVTASSVVAIFDTERSSRDRDAAVLRLPIEPPAINPVLQNLDGRFYSGDLPKRAVGFSHKEGGTFTGSVGAAITSYRLPTKGGFLSGPVGFYEFPHLFPLHDTTDGRVGLSGSPVFYEDGVIGLVHLTREESSDRQREAYIVPISVWGEKWPELKRFIEPFTDRQLRSRAILKSALAVDIEADLGVAGYVEDAYVERLIDAEAQRMVGRSDRSATVMIVGKPKSGKTRLAFRLLATFPDELVIIPKSASPPDEWQTWILRDRGVTLLFDDLHAKPSWEPMAWMDAIKGSGAHHCHTIVTARDGTDLAQLIRSHSLFFEAIGGERAIVHTSGGNGGGDFAQARQLADMLGLDEPEARRRFDGTPGSLTLDISAMRQRYIRLRDYTVADVAQSRLLDSAKLLRDAFTPILRTDTLRWVCENIRGNRALSEEEWAALKRHTLEEGFGRFSDEDERFEIYTPYLEDCVAYAPSVGEIKALAPFLLDHGETVLPIANALFLRHQDFNSGRKLLSAAVDRGVNSKRDLAMFLHLRSANDKETAALLREAIEDSDGHDLALMETLLGTVLVNAPGEEAECERLLRAAVRRGFYLAYRELARLFERLPGREKDAEQAFRDGIAAAEESGRRSFFNDLGVFLCNRKRWEEAAEEFRRGCAIGDTLACRNLCRYHLGTGTAISDPAAVLQWFQQCAQGEDLRMLGSLLAQQGFIGLAEQSLVVAIDRGLWQALEDLTILLTTTERIERLREVVASHVKNFTGEQFRRVGNSFFQIDPIAAGLQSLLGGAREPQKGQPDQTREKAWWPAAEILFRQAIRSGDRVSSFRLGLLLAQDPSRAAETEAAYRDAIAGGVAPAYSALGNLLAGNAARWSEAEEIYRRGIGADDKGSFVGLVLLLARMPGRQEDRNNVAALAVERGIIKLPLS
jgi:hypothetical protein